MKKTLHLTDQQLESADYRNIITLDGVNITDSHPYLYLMLNIPRGKAYAGLSYATGKTHCREGRDHTVDFYSGSPQDHNAMQGWIETDPPEHFVKVIVQNFPLPKNYARWGEKRKRQWLEDNLGQGEKELIQYIRDKWGNHNENENGVLTNVSDGGINGGGSCGLGEDHPDSIPVIELVTGKVYAGLAEAERGTGINHCVISTQSTHNAKKVLKGKMLTTSSRPGLIGRTCWMRLPEFQDAISRGQSVEVIDYYKRDAEVVRLRDSGMTWGQVGNVVGVSASSAWRAYRRIKNGDKPAKRLNGTGKLKRDSEVRRLRDTEGLSFQKIGDLFGLSETGAYHAYNRTKLQENT